MDCRSDGERQSPRNSIASVLILVLRTDHLAVPIIVAVLVAVVAVAAIIGAGGSCCADRGGTVAQTRAIIAPAIAIAGAARNRTSRIAWTACDRPVCNRVRGVNASCIAAAAMYPA